MPILGNERHERFAQELASGKSASEAYVIAGYKESRQNAATLRQKQDISNRVNELLAERNRIAEKASEKAVEKLALTREWVLANLMENAQRALQAIPVKGDDWETLGQYKYEGSVANRALELLGKELGMFVDRKETGAPGDFANLDAAGIRKAIAQRLGLAEPPVDDKVEPPREQGAFGGESSRVH
jgi:hypothetical protein